MQLPTNTNVRLLDFADLHALWAEHRNSWRWTCPFVTPPWLLAWWRCFGHGLQPLLLQVERDGAPIGFAPLMTRAGEASIIGSEDLCDYADFLVAPGREEVFFPVLIDFLRDRGIQRLRLDALRPDSLALQNLLPAAGACGCPVALQPNGVSVRMSLPGTWEDYLQSLSAKQRHEVRRKIRRAAESGSLRLRHITDGADVHPAMDIFIDFFRQSRPDKNDFMTAAREGFFRALADELAASGMLDLCLIEIESRPAAVVFCVGLGPATYLYNNGFDPRFRDISIGVVSKVMTIRASIEAGKTVYDFLNGAEPYKYQLGGKEVCLSTCTVTL